MAAIDDAVLKLPRKPVFTLSMNDFKTAAQQQMRISKPPSLFSDNLHTFIHWLIYVKDRNVTTRS